MLKEVDHLRDLIEQRDYNNIYDIVNRDGSIVKRRDTFGSYALHYVCCKRVPLEIAVVILEAGANINAQNAKGERPIQIACHPETGNLAIALELLRRDAILTISDMNIDILAEAFTGSFSPVRERTIGRKCNSDYSDDNDESSDDKSSHYNMSFDHKFDHKGSEEEGDKMSPSGSPKYGKGRHRTMSYVPPSNLKDKAA